MNSNCKCLQYGDSYLNIAGLGGASLIQERVRVRECTYSMTKECYCAICTKCSLHQPK